MSAVSQERTSACRQPGLEEAFTVVRAIAIVGVVLGRHVLADFEVCGKLSHLATMRRRLGIFAFCGLIPAWALSQTKRYRPEAAAAAAD